MFQGGFLLSVPCFYVGADQFIVELLYSTDLTRGGGGGLEIPCLLIFTGKRADVNKAEKLLSLPLALADQSGMPKFKLQDSSSSSSDKVWLRLGGIVLKLTEKNIITTGGKLTDLHMDFAQKLMKKQFPLLKGLRSTLLQSREEPQQDCSCNDPSYTLPR